MPLYDFQKSDPGAPVMASGFHVIFVVCMLYCRCIFNIGLYYCAICDLKFPLKSKLERHLSSDDHRLYAVIR